MSLHDIHSPQSQQSHCDRERNNHNGQKWAPGHHVRCKYASAPHSRATLASLSKTINAVQRKQLERGARILSSALSVVLFYNVVHLFVFYCPFDQQHHTGCRVDDKNKCSCRCRKFIGLRRRYFYSYY